jgi:hypothetical protein
VAFVAGNQTRLITGPFHLSAYAASLTAGASVATIERTPLTASAGEYIAGQASHTLTVETMVDDDTSAGGYWDTLTANYAGHESAPVTVAPGGFSVGSPVWLADAYQMMLAPSSTAAGGVDLAITYQVTGEAEFGQSLAAHASVSASGNGSVVDGGAASSNGGIAHLHVTEVDGTSPELDVIIEHSTSGSGSWATLATFSQVTTAPGAQRVVVAPGTTVRRYLRAVYTLDGTTPVYTLAVAFARS